MSHSEQHTNIGPIIMISVGIIILIGVAFWVLLNSMLIPSAIASTADSSLTPSIDPLSVIPRVSEADAKQAYDQHTAFFLDVRDSDTYAAGHVIGAKNIPLSDLQSNSSALDPNQWIITYCT